MYLGGPPLRIKNLLESNPLKFQTLGPWIGRIANGPCDKGPTSRGKVNSKTSKEVVTGFHWFLILCVLLV